MGPLGHRIAGFIGASLEAGAALAFTVGVIVFAMGVGGRW